MIAYIVLMVVVIGLLVIWIKHRSHKASYLIKKWTGQNNYEILDKEYRFLSKGPFFFPTRGLHMVYYVTVKDNEGRVRNGWIKIGDWFFGMLFTETVKVEWDTPLSFADDDSNK